MSLANRIQQELRQLCYVRRVTTTSRYVSGQQDGWVYDPALRCDWVTHEAGLRIGTAQISHVPTVLDQQAQAFERILDRYSPDDQVRVVVLPYDDPLQGGDDEGDTSGGGGGFGGSGGSGGGVVLFEGILQRPTIDVAADRERVTWRAAHLCTHDNRATAHLIGGRWIFERIPATEDTAPSGRVRVIDGLCVPPVANFRGRPNRAAQQVTTADGRFAFHPFAAGGEDDPEAGYWTARELLLSILGQWLIGDSGAGTRPRTFDVEPVTLAALTGSMPPVDRFAGLDDELDEIDLSGLHVLEAIDRVCQAIGMQWAIVRRAASSTLPQPDRDWMLRLWQTHTGPVIYPSLSPRGDSHADAERALQANDVSAVHLMRDASGLVNEVFAVGRTFIEARYELLPMWSPADVSDDELTSGLQTTTSEQQDGEGYHARHVAGGRLFDLFGHVGRVWGLDCAGVGIGYGEGPYTHEVGGFDFVRHLGLDGPVADADLDSSPLLALRHRRGITQPIVWSRRVRHLLPLVSADEEWVLECSEDGGDTWHHCSLQAASLRDAFGLQLVVNNLAAINLAAIATGQMPAIEQSWWYLMRWELLRFRVTCGVEADHGFRANAQHLPSSGSVYALGELYRDPNLAEWWRSPDHYYADPEQGWLILDGWRRAPGQGGRQGQLRAVVDDLAQRERDRLQHATFSGRLATWIVELDKYQLGQQVGGLRGRNYSFAVSTGADGAVHYPNVVGITYTLTPGGQSLQLTLDDHRLSAGRR